MKRNERSLAITTYPTSLKGRVSFHIKRNNIFYFSDSFQGKIIIFDLLSKKSIIIDDQDVLKPVNIPVKLDNGKDATNQRFGVSGIALQVIYHYMYYLYCDIEKHVV